MKKITKVIGAFLLFLGISTNMNAQLASGVASGVGAEFFTEERALTADEFKADLVIAIKSAHTTGKDKWMDFHGSTNPAANMNQTFNNNNLFIVEAGSNGGFVLRRKSDNKYLGATGLVDAKEQAQDLTVVHPTTSVSTAPANNAYTSFNNADTWYPLWSGAIESTNNPDYVSPYLLRFMKYGSDSENLNASQDCFNAGKGSWTVFYAVDVTDYEYSPVKFSDAPSNGQFAANTYWYYLKLNSKYATYNVDNNYIPLSTKNLISYGSFWTFVKDENGDIEVYNAATGTSHVLASVQPTTENCTSIQPSLTDKNSLGEKVAKWEISISNTDNSFFLNLKENTSCVLNDADNKGIMAFWTAKDDGSKLIVEAVDIAEVITTVKEQQKAITGAVGTLSPDSYSEFNTALGEGTVEGLVEALKIRDVTGNTVPLNPNIYYRLQNVMRGGVLQINTQSSSSDYKKLTQSSMDKTNANMLWKIEQTEGIENGVKLYHVNAQGYAGAPGNTTLNETGAQYIKVDWGVGNYGFKANGTSNYLVQFSGGGIGSWYEGGRGSDHAWYIMPAEDIELNISEVGYATVNYPFAVQLPENESISAYIGTVIANESSKLLLKKISNGLIPANTPVVLEGVQGEAKTYTLTIVADDASTNPEENVLKGTLLPEAISETFVLGTNNEKVVGFYKLSDTDNTVGANKAYLPKSVLPTSPAGVKGVTFSFDDNSGETTGIEDATINLAEEEFYDLQGRRVMNPTKGIYVTKSGKKVLFTK